MTKSYITFHSSKAAADQWVALRVQSGAQLVGVFGPCSRVSMDNHVETPPQDIAMLAFDEGWIVLLNKLS